MTKNKNCVPNAGDCLTVSRVINAPCEMVFKAWTEPGQMVQWWSPAEVDCRSVEADLKVGGKYRIQMVDKDGNHIACGKYQEIIPNQRLRFTWEWEEKKMPLTTIVVEFEDLGKATRLTLVQKGFVEKTDFEAHMDGWNTAIEKFADLIEQNKIKP